MKMQSKQQKKLRAMQASALALSALLLFGAAAGGTDWSDGANVMLDTAGVTETISGAVRPASVTLGANNITITGENNASITANAVSEKPLILMDQNTDEQITFSVKNVSLSNGADTENPGGVLILLGPNAKLNLSGSTLRGNSFTPSLADGTNDLKGAAIRGGVTLEIFADAGSTVTFADNSTIYESGSFTGEADPVTAALWNGHELKLSGGSFVFENNKVSYSGDLSDFHSGLLGAAVGINKGSMIMNGETFTFKNNVAEITADSGATGNEVEVSGGAIESEIDVVAQSGMFVFSGNTVKIDNSKADVSDSIAKGGAIHAFGKVVLNGDSIEFADNTTIVSTAGSAHVYGGAIMSDGEADPANYGETRMINSEYDVDLTAKTIRFVGNAVSADGNNTVTAQGGAIYANSVKLNGGTVELLNNTTSVLNGYQDNSGGAVYAKGDVTIVADDVITVSGNKAQHRDGTWGSAHSGGAIAAQGNVALTAPEIVVSDNYAGNSGGAIHSKGAITVMAQNTLTVSDNRVSQSGNYGMGVAAGEENWISNMGGAFQSANRITLESPQITISNNSISGTIRSIGKNIEGTLGRESLGGALRAQNEGIFITAGTLDVINNSVTTVISFDRSVVADGGLVRSDASGGALFIRADSQITADTATFSGNKASSTAESGEAYASGGAVFLRSGSSVLSSETLVFSDNVVEAVNKSGRAIARGGAIYISASSMNNSIEGGAIEFSDNKATSSGGKAADGSDTIGGGAQGGAVYSNGSVVLSADTIDLTGNRSTASDAYSRAVANGGAIFASNDVVMMGKNVDVTENCTEGTGAADGVYSRGGAIAGNEGVSITGDAIVFKNNTATMKASGVSSNIESDALGGAVYSRYGKVVIQGGTINFIGNKASVVVDAGTEATAAGGAIHSRVEDIVLEGTDIVFRDNTVMAQNDSGPVYAHGGAVYARDKNITITGETIEFVGNSAIAAGATPSAFGGAVFARSGAVFLSAKNITFGSATDDVFAAIKLTMNGAVDAAQGVIFASGFKIISKAIQGDGIELGEGSSLTLTGVKKNDANDTTKLTTFIAPTVNFGTAPKLTVKGIDGKGEYDFAVIGTSDGTYQGTFDVSAYRNAKIEMNEYDESLDNWRNYAFEGMKYKKLTLIAEPYDLVWNGDSNVWGLKDGKKNWLVSGGSTAEDFYNGDTVSFTDASAGAVSLTGELAPKQMNVSGTYTFNGDGKVFVDTLNIAGGQSEFAAAFEIDSLNITNGQSAFAHEIVARNTVLSGGSLALNELFTTASFIAKSGSTLIIDGEKARLSALLQGVTGEKSTLTIEDGASLYVKNAGTISSEGVQFYLASGFDSDAMWNSANVGSDATVAESGATLNYAQEWSSDTLMLKIVSTGGSTPTPAPVPSGSVVPSPAVAASAPAAQAGTVSMTVAGVVGSSVQNHAAGLATAGGFSPMNTAMGFMPLAPGKKSGVWADTWYTRSRVDGLEVAGVKQDFKIKDYGVTIGYDRKLRSGAVTGLAVSLGKMEAKGQNNWDGSKTDGRHIGVSAYGAKDFGRWTLTGDLGMTWHNSDSESASTSGIVYADDVKSRIFTVGATAFWNLHVSSQLTVRPFVGIRYNHFSQDSFTSFMSGKALNTSKSDSVNQFTIPIGVRFDWLTKETSRGWKLHPSAEIAYVRAAGDLKQNIRQIAVSGGAADHGYSAVLADKDTFRASLGLEAKRKNFTLGVNLSGQISSNQKDYGVSAVVRWDL